MYACNCIYNHLPEDELSGSKHVEDIKIKNEAFNLENVLFIGLYCIIILQCIVQKNIKVIITNVTSVPSVTVAISSSRDNNTENMLELLLSMNIS
jgi:hypothetical protein